MQHYLPLFKLFEANTKDSFKEIYLNLHDKKSLSNSFGIVPWGIYKKNFCEKVHLR